MDFEDGQVVDLDELEAQVVDLDALEGKPRPAPPRPKKRPSKRPRQPIIPIKVTPEMRRHQQTSLEVDRIIRSAREDQSIYGYKRPTKMEQMMDEAPPVVITGRTPPKRPARPTKGPLISDLPEIDPVTGKPLGPPQLEQPGWAGQIVNKALRIPMVAPKLAESAGEAVDALVYGLSRLEGGTPEEIAQRQTRITPYIKKVTEGYVNPFIRGFAPQDPAKQGYAVDTAAGGLASAGEFLLAGWLGRSIGIPSKVVSGTVGAGLNINEALAEADKLGASPDQRAVLTLLSGLTGLTEMGGLGRTIEGFGLSQLFKQRVNEILEEGGQEALQTWLNNLNMVVTRVDPDRPLTRDVLESAILGGAIGGVIHGGAYAKQKLFPERTDVSNYISDTGQLRVIQGGKAPSAPQFQRGGSIGAATIPPPQGYVPPTPRQRPVPKSMRSSRMQPAWDMMLMSEDRDANLNKLLQKSQVQAPLYHGTSSPTEISEIDPSKFDDDALFGPGFYMTQSPDVAARGDGDSYASKKQPEIPWADAPNHPSYPGYLQEEIDKQRKFLEENHPDTVAAMAPDTLERSIKSYAHTQAVSRVREEAAAGTPTAYKFHAQITNAFDINAPIAKDEQQRIAQIAINNGAEKFAAYLPERDTGFYVYDQLKRAFGGDKAKVNDVLRKAGYDGITHIGGEGKTLHTYNSREEAEAKAQEIGGSVKIRTWTGEGIGIGYYPYLQKFLQEHSGEDWSDTSIARIGYIRYVVDQMQSQGVQLPPEAQRELDTIPANIQYDVSGHKVWIAFPGAVVKSATGNSGEYSPTDPKIYRELGEELTPLEASKLDDMVFDVMPALRAGQAPYLRAPRWVIRALGPRSGGVNIVLDQVDDILYKVGLAAPSSEHADEANRAILDLAEQAKAEGINSLSIVRNDLPESTIRGIIEHEVTHAGERELPPPDDDWIDNHPLLQDVLNRTPYPNNPNQTVHQAMFPNLNPDSARFVLSREIISYYVQGRTERLGMTNEEARQFFKDYLNHMRSTYGQEAVDNFRNVVRMKQSALDVIDESDSEARAWEQELRRRGQERSAVFNNYNPGLDGPLDLPLHSAGDIVYPPNVRVNDVIRKVGDSSRARVNATHKDGVFITYIDGPHEGMSEKIPWSMAVESLDPDLSKTEQVTRELSRKPVIPSASELGVGGPPARIGGEAGVQQNSSPVFQIGQVVRPLDHEDNVIDEDMTIIELDVDEYGPLVRAQRHDDGGVGEFRLDRIRLASEAGRPPTRPLKLQKYDPTKGRERMAARRGPVAPPPSGPGGPEGPHLPPPPPGPGRPFRHPRIMTDRMDNTYQRAVDRAYTSLLEKGGVTLDSTRRVFTQVVDAIESGKITSQQFDEALEENGMTIQQFVDEYKITVHEAALTLYELSRIKAKYTSIIKKNPALANKFLSVQDQLDALLDQLNDTILGKNVWQRGSSIIRMMMLSDLRTAFVNAWVTTGRIPLSIVNHGLGAWMHSMHKSKGNPNGLVQRMKIAAKDMKRATEIGVEVLLALKPSEFIYNRVDNPPTGGKHLEYQQVIDQLTKQFPDLEGRLISPGIGDVHISKLGTKLDEARNLAGSIVDNKARQKALNDLKKFEDRHRSNMNNWAKKGLYGAEWGLEQLLTPMRWQELLFRRPMFVAYLNYGLEKQGLNFADLASRDQLAKIPEQVLNDAIDEALDFTYSYMPHYEENSPWGEKRAHEFINAINRLGPISALGGIAFPRAVYNGVKFVYEYSPLGAMPYFVKKFKQLKGMDVIHDPTLPNVHYKAKGSELTERDFQRVAKAMTGTVMFAIAMGMIKAGMIGDEWWKMKVPFGTYLTNSGNPLYVDLRKFQPLSTFVRLADMTSRAGGSLLETDWFGRQRGDLHMGQELKEIFTGMRNFPGVEELTNSFFEMWDDGQGADWDKGWQSVGMSMSFLTRPLINVRDAIAIFDDEEQKQKDLKGTNIWGPLVDNVPWLRSYLLENKTDPNKSPVETMYAPALSFPMGAKMVEGENFAGREWKRLGLLNKRFLMADPNPTINRAQNEAFFEYMDPIADELENDPEYASMNDAEKAARWEVLSKKARSIARKVGQQADEDERAKRVIREKSRMGPLERKSTGFEEELRNIK